jgi:hypothetical protein
MEAPSRTAPPILVNTTYWFERELRQYPGGDLDLDALAEYADCIVLAAGRESHAYPSYEVTIELGRGLGLEVTGLTGGHVGFLSDLDAFVPALRRALERAGLGPNAWRAHQHALGQDMDSRPLRAKGEDTRVRDRGGPCRES